MAFSALVTGCGEPDATGGPLDVVVVHGETGRFPGQYAYPRGIDAYGETLLIVDKSARVQRIDAKTGDFLGGWTMPESELGKPTGLTVGPHPADGTRSALYVADTHYHRIMVYALPEDPAAVTSRTVEGPPEPVVSFGAYGFGDGQFVYPTDVALLLSGDPARPVTRIYVSEYGGNDRISIWEPDADDPLLIRYVRSFGEHGSGPGVIFHRPQSITVDAARQELIVADSGNHRIGRFTLEGERIAWIGGMETAGGEEGFHYPYGVTLLDDGTFLICEYGGCRLRRVDLHAAEPEGVWLGRYGVAGRLAGELFNPWGAAVIGKTGYVLDSGNSRVQAFRLPVGASSSGVRVTQGAAP